MSPHASPWPRRRSACRRPRCPRPGRPGSRPSMGLRGTSGHRARARVVARVRRGMRVHCAKVAARSDQSLLIPTRRSHGQVEDLDDGGADARARAHRLDRAMWSATTRRGGWRDWPAAPAPVTRRASRSSPRRPHRVHLRDARAVVPIDLDAASLAHLQSGGAGQTGFGPHADRHDDQFRRDNLTGGEADVARRDRPHRLAEAHARRRFDATHRRPVPPSRDPAGRGPGSWPRQWSWRSCGGSGSRRFRPR